MQLTPELQSEDWADFPAPLLLLGLVGRELGTLVVVSATTLFLRSLQGSLALLLTGTRLAAHIIRLLQRCFLAHW